ncbi:MAG: BREX-1 system adenine-specific DNA-methyltransferase PglX [Lachnospiraceae bacterium]|nr:BREX-1 system adenine-specific DNA-methyltransferase PglX [Lachnospiraceae bacterium]
MDKTAIRNFAIEARKILMKSAITEAGFYGITKDGCKDPVQKGNDFEVYETVAGTENRIFGDDIKRRANLVQAIKTLGFEQVIEETAYTWFNRIIAIRFMEVNNYLPTRVRVLSSETGSGTPDIITQADTVELNFTSDELEKIQTAKRENRYDDAFRMLFIKQCNELNAILPGLFEKTDDYMELLLKITYTGDGVIRMLVDSIPEDNFNVETEGQVEIIGWMYQYYNTELKDDTFAKLKKNVKITKERIPAATQLFTPDWIVRYMVENSLGRVWIEHLRAVNPSVDEKAKAEEFGWKYYLPEAEQEDDVQAQLVEIRKSYKDLTPQDITCIDPCMGSGHILVYMFDVLMDIYRSEGFSEREAVFDILEKNIRGLDIDRRAYQLSYFALMMKARGYNRIFFRGHEDLEGNRVQVVPRVYAIEESNSIDREQLKYFGAGLDELSKNNAINQMNGLLDALHDAKEFGSILNVEKYEWKLLRAFLADIEEEGQASLFAFAAYMSQALLEKIVELGELLSNQYDVVVTNPPYMGGTGMSPKLDAYIKDKYDRAKTDLYSVFIERCREFTKYNRYQAMITQHGWMYLSSFEKMRRYMLECTVINMAHLGARAFDEINGEVVQSVAFILQKSDSLDDYNGHYVRLLDYSGEEEKRKGFFAIENHMLSRQNEYMRIPGVPVAYWSSKDVIRAFEEAKPLSDIAEPRQGVKTLNNDLFLKLWFEVDINHLVFGCSSIEESVQSGGKWFPYNKGGTFRKWYGNNDYVVNWFNDGEDMKKLAVEKYKSVTRTITNIGYFFKEGLTWSSLSSGNISLRAFGKGYIFDSKGSSMFFNDAKRKLYVLALINSKISMKFLEFLAPTLDFNIGPLSKIPVRICEEKFEEIDALVQENIELAKEDWDSFETSWDFEEHPLVRLSHGLWDATAVSAAMHSFYGNLPEVSCPVELAYLLWAGECERRFNKLKENEEKLNQLFIDIYGLNEEMNPFIEDSDITVRKADRERETKSLISYAVGCMFGRYSLVKTGLAYAGGEWNEEQYGDFTADKDAIIPITDEPYFDDDIVGRFVEFIRFVFGEESLEANLEYISDCLGTKGSSSREKIRQYFIDGFYKDHCDTYSVTGSGKRPIYWLFDSGKQNGFKSLIYVHRYNSDTVGIVRSDYLTKVQSMIENALRNAEYAINTSTSAVDKAQATKKRDKYIKQLAEIRAYYPALSHIALQRINLDLDDGVKVNYEKFQGIEVSIEGEKKQKVDLLAKI